MYIVRNIIKINAIENVVLWTVTALGLAVSGNVLLWLGTSGLISLRGGGTGIKPYSNQMG